MRPLYRSLMVFSLFSVLAAHVYHRALDAYLADLAPRALATLDKVLYTLLVGPLGPEIAVYVLLAVGAFFSLWAYMAGLAASGSRREERFSTW